MLFLLTVLIDVLAPRYLDVVTVGNGLWCDYPPHNINQVLREHDEVAITSGVIWPPLSITHGVSITGGYHSCVAAKLGIETSSMSQIRGDALRPVITIDINAPTAVKINLSKLIVEWGRSQSGSGIFATGDHFQLHLDQILLQNNMATGIGGGLLVSGQNNAIKLTNSVLQNNQALKGAGLVMQGSGNLLTIENTEVRNNLAQIAGGGVLCDGLNLIKISRSEVSDNKANWGSNWYKDLQCQLQYGSPSTKLGTMPSNQAVN